LKGKGAIECGPEQSKAFAELKDYIEKMQYYPHLRRRNHFSYTWQSQRLQSALL
jgi:hypothetical protein